jgi:hypothetical protein
VIRRLLTISCSAGIVLSVVAWGVSYFGVHFLIRRDFSPQDFSFIAYSVSVESGAVLVSRARGEVTARTQFPNGLPPSDFFTGRMYKESWWWPEYTNTTTLAGGILPLWIPAFMFAVLSIPAFRKHRRRRRARLGLCAACAYDLRGSKTFCSECGTECEVPANA